MNAWHQNKGVTTYLSHRSRGFFCTFSIQGSRIHERKVLKICIDKEFEWSCNITASPSVSLQLPSDQAVSGTGFHKHRDGRFCGAKLALLAIIHGVHWCHQYMRH